MKKTNGWALRCAPILLVIIVTIFVAPAGFLGQDVNQMKGCEYWQSLVDAELNPPATAEKVDKMVVSNILDGHEGQKVPEMDQSTVFAGIGCLLQMEGNKRRARFSGATKPYVSQLFEPATADVGALYYISFLYEKKWAHADAIALRDEDGDVNKPAAIRQAYKSYRKWFEKVKEVGLEKAREMKLKPLAETKVHWY